MRNLRRITLTVLASAAVIVGLTACDPDDNLSSPASLTTTTDSFARFSAPTSEMQIAAPAKADPYSTDGTWLVPSEIAPGDYRAYPNGGIVSYLEVCADAGCDIDFDGSDYTGMISNDNVTGSSIVHIPDFAYSIKLEGVRLEPLG